MRHTERLYAFGTVSYNKEGCDIKKKKYALAQDWLVKDGNPEEWFEWEVTLEVSKKANGDWNTSGTPAILTAPTDVNIPPIANKNEKDTIQELEKTAPSKDFKNCDDAEKYFKSLILNAKMSGSRFRGGFYVPNVRPGFYVGKSE